MIECEPLYLFRSCIQALKENICKPLDKFITTLPDCAILSIEEIQTQCSEKLPDIIQSIRKNCRHINRLWQVTLQLHCTLTIAEFEDRLAIGWEDAVSYLLEIITCNMKQYSSMPYFSAIRLLEEELNAFIHSSLPLPVLLDGVETYLEIQNVRKEAECETLLRDDDRDNSAADADDGGEGRGLDNDTMKGENNGISEVTPQGGGIPVIHSQKKESAAVSSQVSIPTCKEIIMPPKEYFRSVTSELGRPIHPPRKQSSRPNISCSTRSEFFPPRNGKYPPPSSKNQAEQQPSTSPVRRSITSTFVPSPPRSPNLPTSPSPRLPQTSPPRHSPKSEIVIPEETQEVPQKNNADIPSVRTETLTEKALYQHTQKNPPQPKLPTNPVRCPKLPSEKPAATVVAPTRRKLSISSLSSEVSSDISEISC